ncbi:MAG: AlpA family transcriptional regulator [Gammaproteobacteria bacterium]
MTIDHLLRLPAVENAVGYKRSTIYRLIAERKFPAPISLGARAVAWRSSEIQRWIDERGSPPNILEATR